MLFRMIGRKGHVGGSCGGLTNLQAFPELVDAYPRFLSMLQEDRMSGGEVKFKDIRRNSKGEGSLLAQG